MWQDNPTHIAAELIVLLPNTAKPAVRQEDCLEHFPDCMPQADKCPTLQ